MKSTEIPITVSARHSPTYKQQVTKCALCSTHSMQMYYEPSKYLPGNVIFTTLANHAGTQRYLPILYGSLHMSHPTDSHASTAAANSGNQLARIHSCCEFRRHCSYNHCCAASLGPQQSPTKNTEQTQIAHQLHGLSACASDSNRSN